MILFIQLHFDINFWNTFFAASYSPPKLIQRPLLNQHENFVSPMSSSSASSGPNLCSLQI